MKKGVLMLVGMALMFGATYLYSKGADVKEVEATGTVAVTTHTWAAIPSTTTIDSNRYRRVKNYDVS